MLLNFLRLRARQFCRDLEARAFFEVLRGVIVILAMRNNFAGNGSLRIVIPENADFDLARVDGFLDDNFQREFRREIQRCRQFLGLCNSSHTNRRSERRRLHE